MSRSARVGPVCFQTLAGRVGSDQEMFEMSRDGSRPVRRCWNVTRRVRSGQKMFEKSHPSGRVTLNQPDPRSSENPTRANGLEIV